jgi:hypothetical protein
MALGLTEPLTETSTRNLSRGGDKMQPACKADVTAICLLIAYKMWEPQWPVVGMALLYLLFTAVFIINSS